MFRGNLAAMPETLGELHCLPLAERDLRIGRKASLVPILVLATAMGLVAFNVVPVAIAFFGAAVVLLLVRSLSLREAYDAIEWPILIMLGALIPVSDALHSTGRHRPDRRLAFACGLRVATRWGRSLCCLSPPWR